MTFLSVVLFVVVAAGCFSLGWGLRRVATSGQEAALRRSMYESKGAIPQLEASLRTRDQRITTYQGEAESMRAKITQLESAVSQRDSEIVRRDRDIRRLTSELEITKEGGGETSDAPLPFDGVLEQAPPDPTAEVRLKKAEARYEALKRGLMQRDEKIVALEHALHEAKERSSLNALETELEALTDSAQSLASKLAGRDGLMKEMEAKLQREAEQREILESLAKRRGDANRELKDKLAKLEVQLPKLMETMKARATTIAERDATIRALTGELEHTQAERAERDATIVSLEQKLAAREQDLAVRDGRLGEQQHRIGELERRVDGLTHEVAAMKRSLQRAEATIQERDASLAQNAAQMASVDLREREHQQAMAALSNTVRDRDFRIDALTAEVTKLTSTLDNTRAESMATHGAQAGAADRLAAETKALRERVELLGRQNDALSKDVAARDRRYAEAERKRAEVDHERARLMERVAALEAPGDSKQHTLEAQLNAARDRCLRIEDELLAANLEAKRLRQRVVELEARDDGAPPANSAEEVDVPMLTNVASGPRVVAPPA